MRHGLVFAIGALFLNPAIAAELEFRGAPLRVVELTEEGAHITEVPESRRKELEVLITRDAGRYLWASRKNVPLTKTESGAYVTYTAATGAGYIRVLSPGMRKAREALSKVDQDKELVYMEHLINRLGSITYYGK